MKQFRPIFLTTSLIIAMGWLAAPAHADLLTVSGSTAGTFSATSSATYDHLSFSGTTFGPTSSDTLTLGSFDLSNGSDTYLTTFDITVTFSWPPGTGGNAISGDVTGSVHGGSGSVTIIFTNPTLFTFPGGSFDLSVNAVTAALDTNGGTAMLTGTLSNEADLPS